MRPSSDEPKAAGHRLEAEPRGPPLAFCRRFLLSGIAGAAEPVEVIHVAHYVWIPLIDALPCACPGLAKADPAEELCILVILVWHLACNEHRQDADSQPGDVFAIQRGLTQRTRHLGVEDAAKRLLVSALNELHSKIDASWVGRFDSVYDRLDDRIQPAHIALGVRSRLQVAGSVAVPLGVKQVTLLNSLGTSLITSVEVDCLHTASRDVSAEKHIRPVRALITRPAPDERQPRARRLIARTARVTREWRCPSSQRFRRADVSAKRSQTLACGLARRPPSDCCS